MTPTEYNHHTICFFNSNIEWGGGEKWHLEMAKKLQEKGYNVLVCAHKNSVLYQKAEEQALPAYAFKISNLSFLNPFCRKKLKAFFIKKTITHIFLNLPSDLKLAAPVAKKAAVPNIIYRRGSAKPIKNRRFTKHLLSDCVTSILSNSQATKKTILQHTSKWLSPEKIKVIYNGINLSEIKIALENEDIRKEFKIEPQTILIANVGRLNIQKGHQYLFEAARIIKEKINDFKILVVGEGNLEEELKEKVKQMNLNEHIIFTGFRKDVYTIIEQSDFLIHTALWEGFGYVIAEAMALSKPVISTDVSNISEIVVDGVTGYLAENKNPRDIAEKTIKMIESQSTWKEMGEKARERVEENFNFDDKVRKLEEFYLKR